jgi:carbonic anhydrase
MFIVKFFTPFVMLPLLVFAHPVVIDLSTTALHQRTPISQTPLTESINSTKEGLHTLQDLYEGNQKFLQNTRVEVAKLVEEAPSFMFLGCTDNRLSPSSIFDAPAGSIISHNNIANQYSSKDPSANAAVAYAVESLHVQHIIVLGHYGCKGVETAITQSSQASRMVKNWVKSISDLYTRSRRREIVILRDSRMPRRGLDEGVKTAPPASDAGFRALVEENVKRGIKELRGSKILTQAYSRDAKAKTNNDVFVHGFVYDEATGEVQDLHISFGPPGKKIPHVPFKVLAAAKNFHRDHDRPGISTGRSWNFGSG